MHFVTFLAVNVQQLKQQFLNHRVVRAGSELNHDLYSLIGLAPGQMGVEHVCHEDFHIVFLVGLEEEEGCGISFGG